MIALQIESLFDQIAVDFLQGSQIISRVTSPGMKFPDFLVRKHDTKVASMRLSPFCVTSVQVNTAFICISFQNPNTFNDETLQTTSVTALAKYMIVSQTLCQDNLQLLFTILERSTYEVGGCGGCLNIDC